MKKKQASKCEVYDDTGVWRPGKETTMNKDERAVLIVNCNIQQANEVLKRVKLANKGRYAHDLNAGEHKLYAVIKDVEKDKTLENKAFMRMCRLKQHLAYLLYASQENI